VASRERARATTHRIRWIRVAGLLVVVAAVAAALGNQLLASSSSTVSSSTGFPSSTALPETVPSSSANRAPIGAPRDELPHRRSDHRGGRGEADGAVPDGTTVFDGGVPGVARLDPALLAALRQAATDAAYDGVEFFVDSGWRSRGYQEHLRQQAILKYGSEAEAARWVATPNTSAHVSGDAADIGRSDAAAWLSEHGADYGLCQIYSNEPWHYELRPVDHGCPPMYADPTHDPRTQR
jgi:D-alanyl-D-alanine carboxypeptidase